MNTTVIATTNPATGTITTTTIIHHSHFHYGWLLLALLATALISSGLRALFWNKDSN
ncbi:MAG: hypothetical protein ABSA12_02635 [Verrucomicrobiia bacterium]|jgi:hypothetical protein